MQKKMEHEMKLGRYMDLETRTPTSGSRAPNSGYLALSRRKGLDWGIISWGVPLVTFARLRA